MKKTINNCAIAFIIMMTCTINVSAQSTMPFTNGPLWQVQFIQTKPGMEPLYAKNLSEGWIKIMRALKEQGVIMDFKVLAAEPASEHDWDLMLMYEIKNHAVLDGLDEKMEASEKKLFGGSQETQHTNAISRNDLRVLQGGKITQELDFK